LIARRNDRIAHEVLMNLADDAVLLRTCLRRILRWRVPPNWTAAEWSKEMRAHGAGALWQARCDFDVKRLVPFDAFARQRVLGAALTRYRQEWTFALHCQVGDDGVGDEPTSAGASVQDEHLAREMLARVSPAENRLMKALFWDGETEATLAVDLSVTQQAVSKRKRTVLRQLRKLLAWPSDSRP
jgi:DNA-directed RNA polymerase specialized sigma subunit